MRQSFWQFCRTVFSYILEQPESSEISLGSEITVMGEVQAPGVFHYPGEIPLRHALYSAGGVTPDADMTGVTVLSKDEKPVQIVNLDQIRQGHLPPVILKAGDTVIVPSKDTSPYGNDGTLHGEAKTVESTVTVDENGKSEILSQRASSASTPGSEIVVMGGVQAPGIFHHNSGKISLQDALDGAGGLTPNADTTRISIFFKNPSQPQHVDLEQIRQGHQPDVVLQAGDMVLVPSKLGKSEIVEQQNSTNREDTPMTTVIPGTWMWDVENNELAASDNVDLSWEHATETERYLVPKNGAKIAVLSDRRYEHIDDVKHLVNISVLSQDKISGADGRNSLVPGTVLGLQTAEGNLAKLRVVRYYKLHDFTFPGAQILPATWKDFVLKNPNIDNYHIELEWRLSKPVW